MTPKQDNRISMDNDGCNTRIVESEQVGPDHIGEIGILCHITSR